MSGTDPTSPPAPPAVGANGSTASSDAACMSTSAVGATLDLERLRLPQNFDETLGVKRLLVTVPVRKPHRQEFVRVHPDEGYRFRAATLAIKEDRITYLVDPALSSELASDLTPTLLTTAITRQGVVFVWPLTLPDPDSRWSEWHRSAHEAADEATKAWIKIVANMHVGAYEIFRANGDLDEPIWPDEPLARLLEIAFKDKVITTVDHPVLRRLRGEM